MWKNLLMVIGLAVLVVGLGCKKTPNPKKTETPKAQKKEERKSQGKKGLKLVGFTPFKGAIAEVNGEKVMAERLNKRVLRLTQGGTRKLPQKRLNQVIKGLLKSIIDETLIDQEAKKEGITVTDAELKEELNKFIKRFPSPKRYKEFLSRARMSEEDMKQWIRHKLRLEKLLEKRGQLAVTEDEARKVYENNLRFYTQPERVHALDILIKLPKDASKEQVKKAQAKAQEVIEALKKGEHFAKLVAKYSEDEQTKGRGGDMGWIKKGMLPKELEAAIFRLKPGEFTKTPVRTDKGLFIVKVVEHKPKVVQSFDAVKSKIMESLRQRKIFTERMKLVRELRSKAKIEIKLNLDEEKK